MSVRLSSSLHGRIRNGGLKIFSALMLSLLLFSSPATSAFANAFNDPGARASAGAGAAANGDFVPVNPTVDGGSISVGSTAQVVVLFRNDSGHPLTVGDIQLYPSSTVTATVTSNQCSSEGLEAAAVCAVSVSVRGVLAGAWRVEMLVRHNGRARLVTAAMTGTVVAGDNSKGGFISDIQSIPDKLDFGEIISSQPVIRSVTLRNATSDAIDINSVYIEAADKAGFTVKTDCSHLVAGQACIAVVTWSPVLGGQASGILVVDHTGPTKVATIDLDGKFSPTTSAEALPFPNAVPGKGLLVASQKDIAFGDTIQTTSAITVSLVNVGDAPLNIKEIRLANSDDGLSISKKGCAADTVLEPVEACPLTLTWSPVRQGPILDDVQIIHDGTRGILVLPVKGTATAAISQDSKAVRLVGGGSGSLESTDSALPVSNGKGGSTSSASASSGGNRHNGDQNIDPATVLDGFVVTSHASSRAIISGPGGSRIVYDGQEMVLGGFVWHINVRPSGVEFRNDSEKVLLLFDSSLSAVGRAAPGTASLTAAGSAAAAVAAAPTSTTTTTSIPAAAAPAAAAVKK